MNLKVIKTLVLEKDGEEYYFKMFAINQTLYEKMQKKWAFMIARFTLKLNFFLGSYFIWILKTWPVL